MGTRNRVGIGVSYRPTGLYMLAESIPGLLRSLKFRALDSERGPGSDKVFLLLWTLILWPECRCEEVASRQATDEELLLYHTKEFIQVIEQSKNQTEEESEAVCSKYDR